MSEVSAWAGRIAEVEARCAGVLASPEFVAVRESAAALGLGPSRLRELAALTARQGMPPEAWDPLAEACERQGISPGAHVPERYLLLSIGVETLGAVSGLPVPGEVKERLLDQFRYVCAPDRETERLLNPRDYGFRAMCKFMLLERFPAGQSDWEISGFPRSFLTKMPLPDVPRALWCVFGRAGGRRPFFESHTAFRRELPIITGDEERKAFRLMAEAMKQQPEVRGYLGSAWFMDPSLEAVSPHLGWLAAWYRECVDFGALWTTLGDASPDAGFLVGDRRRRRLYEAGQWKPLQGLIVWARSDMLRWLDWQRA